MRRKTDIEQGLRAYSEVQRLFPNKKKCEIARLIGCDRKTVNEWRQGCCPDGLFLKRLHYLGADIVWIVTGERSGAYGKTL